MEITYNVEVTFNGAQGTFLKWEGLDHNDLSELLRALDGVEIHQNSGLLKTGPIILIEGKSE